MGDGISFLFNPEKMLSYFFIIMGKAGIPLHFSHRAVTNGVALK